MNIQSISVAESKAWDQYVILQVILEDAYKKILLAEDKHDKAKKYFVTYFKYKPPQNATTFTEDELIDQIKNRTPKIPKILSIFTENSDFYIFQDYINVSESHKDLVLRNEYELVLFLNRLLPTLSFLHDLELYVAPDGKLEDLRSLVVFALESMTTEGSLSAYNSKTKSLNLEACLLSDQRAQVLQHILSEDQAIPSADVALRAFNTVEQSRDKKPLPSLVLYWIAALGGLLILVALMSLLLSKREQPTSIKPPDPIVEEDFGCPTDADVLAIGCSISISDPDSLNFNDGKLVVRVSKGATAEDRIFIQQRNVSVNETDQGQEVIYGDTVIAKLMPSNSEANLEVLLNENASLEVINLLVKDIVYQNVSENLTSGTREVEFKLIDGDGRNSNSVTTKIATYPENSPPKVIVPSSQTTKEDSELSIGSIKLDDPDVGGDIVTVLLVANRGTLQIKSNIDGGVPAGSVVYSDDRRQIGLRGTLSQVSKTLAAADAILYRADPNFSGSDTLTVSVSDSGQSVNGNANWIWPVNALEPQTASSSIAINVEAVNDPPILSLANDDVLNPETSVPSSDVNSSLDQNTNATVSGKAEEPLKNIRSGPNTEATILFKLPIGSRVRIIDSTQNEDDFLWYKIYSPEENAEGWIASQLLTPD